MIKLVIIYYLSMIIMSLLALIFAKRKLSKKQKRSYVKQTFLYSWYFFPINAAKGVYLGIKEGLKEDKK